MATRLERAVPIERAGPRWALAAVAGGAIAAVAAVAARRRRGHAEQPPRPTEEETDVFTSAAVPIPADGVATPVAA